MLISKYVAEESKWVTENTIGIVINNLPNLGKDTKYIVCWLYMCRLYYYAQYPKDCESVAQAVAKTIQGVVVEVK